MDKSKMLSSLFLVAAFFGGARLAYAQGVDTIVEVPTTAHRSALIEIPTAQTTSQSDADNNVTMAGEYKSTKNVVEEEKPVFWTWFTDVGYTSEYNFRGTNLTPNSDGAGFFDARVTKWSFTLGFFGIHQFGNASSPSWSIGEGGGGGIPNTQQNINVGPSPYTRFPTTTQTRFNELDVFLSYKISFGPVDVTIGNIGFFIDRRAVTFETDVIPVESPQFIWVVPPTFTRFRTVGPNPTVRDEVFDRAYITLSTTKISKYITPQITYYQTLASGGQEPEGEGLVFYPPDVNGNRPKNARPNDERNEALGGYLEGRINGSFPLGNWVDFNPYGIISMSFRDRTEPGGSNPYGGHPLTGWNHVQAGAELPIHLIHLGGSSSTQWAAPDANLYFVPFGAYSYHISNPVAGTHRNESWGGAKFELTF